MATLFAAGVVMAGGYAAKNLWSYHLFDKYVIKQVEIAANTPSLTSTTGVSMVSALTESDKHLGVSPLENTSLFWKTPETDIKTLDDLLKKSIRRSEELSMLQTGYVTGTVPAQAPDWVKNAHNSLRADGTPLERQLATSEYGQRIASEYESVNSVVAGGTRLSAKKLQERHRSLLDTLDKAAGLRSIVRFQADEYMTASAHTFIAYMKANLGYTGEAVQHLQTARDAMRVFSPDKNLSILRDTPELSQRTINGMLDSSINEISLLDNDPDKFSTGWWRRLRYFNQSIGGQENPSVQDMAEDINHRYFLRAEIAGGIMAFMFYIAGGFVKRYKQASQYAVGRETHE